MTKQDITITTAILRAASTRARDGRALIADVYTSCALSGAIGDMSLDSFKALCLELRAAGTLRLTRCDMVGSLSPMKVRASECQYLSGVFHFIAV